MKNINIGLVRVSTPSDIGVEVQKKRIEKRVEVLKFFAETGTSYTTMAVVDGILDYISEYRESGDKVQVFVCGVDRLSRHRDHSRSVLQRFKDNKISVIDVETGIDLTEDVLI